MVYTLEVPSKSSAQNLSVSLKDIAGNEANVGVNDFLITTNFFILWFNNTPLFIASIVGVLALIGVSVLFFVRKRKNY